MTSEQGRRILVDLWSLPGSNGLTVEQWRAAAEQSEKDPWPDNLHAQPVDAGGVAAEWAWLNDADRDGPVVLVLHGGGFVLCTIGTHRRLGAEVAWRGRGRALVVGYRRAPEHPFPAAVEDCVTAYRWLLDQDVDPERIVLFGDSAGGALCLATCLSLRDAGVALPKAQVLASPLTDMTFSSGSITANQAHDPFSRLDDFDRLAALYLQGADPAQPLASPLWADLHGLPPALVLVGPGERLLDDSLRLAEKGARQGMVVDIEVVDGAFHTWLNYAGALPEADDALARMERWLAPRLPRPSGDE